MGIELWMLLPWLGFLPRLGLLPLLLLVLILGLVLAELLLPRCRVGEKGGCIAQGDSVGVSKWGSGGVIGGSVRAGGARLELSLTWSLEVTKEFSHPGIFFRILLPRFSMNIFSLDFMFLIIRF